MSIIFAARDDKARIFDMVEKIVQSTLLPHLAVGGQAAVIAHFAHLRSRPEALQVQTKFETVPETQSTTIELKLWFGAKK